MIKKDEMMGLLLGTCPSFQATWEAFLHEWRDSSEDLPHYLALADFARHLIGMLERGQTETFQQIFEAVERLQLEGEHYVQEAAVVGLLEDLQNLHLHTRTRPDQFREFLGPESIKAWDALNHFWCDVHAAKEAGPLGSAKPPIDPDSVEDPELRRMIQQMYRKGTS
jgi:hypothetical protein